MSGKLSGDNFLGGGMGFAMISPFLRLPMFHRQLLRGTAAGGADPRAEVVCGPPRVPGPLRQWPRCGVEARNPVTCWMASSGLVAPRLVQYPDLINKYLGMIIE